jgi:hypothetical protein
MITILDKYKSEGEFSFPNRDIDPKLKNAEYDRKNAEAIYSLYCKNQCAWGSAQASNFTTNRLYSTGNQDIEQYKSWLLNDSSDDGTTAVADSFDSTPLSRVAKREGWYNLIWKNLSPAPMILNNLHGALDKQDFDLYVDTIDSDSRGLVEDEKYRKMVEAKFADWQIEYKKKAGIPVDEQMIYPRTPEEFDMFEAEDGFKLAVATSMQKLVRHSFSISDWDGEIHKNLVDDLVCIGYAATRDYFDAGKGKWVTKYLDPAYLVAQYSNSRGYKDSEYFGYQTYWTVSNLRNKLPNCTENELKGLAQQCFGKYGNPSSNWETKYSLLDPTTQTYKGIDSFKVPVFEAVWMDFDSEKRLYYRNRHGRDLIIDLGFNDRVKPVSEESKKLGAKKEVKKIGMRVPRECCWVMGTDYVFDNGIIRMASRKDLNDPQLPFHVEQLLQPSIIENLRPILDEITQLALRYQNSLAMMVERGYAINTSMLGNVNLGSGTLPIAENIKMWNQTGRLLYSYGGNGLYTGGAALPITPIDGGLGTRVDETIKSLEFAFKKIELFIGINLASLGVTPEPNVPTSTTKEAMQATMNALKPIIDACLEIKQSAGECMMRRIQVGIKNSEVIRDTYKGVISPTEIDAIKEMEANGVQYGLTLKAKPDGMMKAQFMKWLDAAVQDTRDGNTGLYTADAMYFTSRLEAGEDIQDLIRQMRYQIKKNREENQQKKSADIQQQIDGNAQNEQQKFNNEMQKAQVEQQGKVQEELIRGEIKQKQGNRDANLAFLTELKKSADAESGITTNTGGK